MLKRLLTSIKLRLGLISHKQLNVEACIKMGMKVGMNVHGLENILIDYAHCWLISIEDNVVFGPQVYLLAHDASTKTHLNYTKIGRINIARKCFIGTRSIIFPGVTIGENSIVAAGSFVTKSIPSNTVVAGQPARPICSTDEYLKKHRGKMDTAKIYGIDYTIKGGITEEMKEQMFHELEGDQIGYVK